MKLKLQLNFEELSENLENNYDIIKLENSIDKVLRFHLRSFVIQIDIISPTISFWNAGRFVFTHFWVIVHSIFGDNYCQLGNE